MARAPRNAVAMRDLGKRLTRLHKRAKAPGFAAMSKELYRDYGYDVHEESIRKAHRMEVDPSQCNVELLLAFAAYYGIEPAELGSIAAARIRTAKALMVSPVAAPSPDDGGSVIGESGSACTRSPQVTYLFGRGVGIDEPMNHAA